MSFYKYQSALGLNPRSILGLLELCLGFIFIGLARSEISIGLLLIFSVSFVLVRVCWMLFEVSGVPKLLIHGGLLFFFISAIIGVGVSYDPQLSLPSLTALIGGYFFLYAVLDIQPKSNEFLIGTLVLAGAIMGLCFIATYSTFEYDAKVGFIHSLGQQLQLFGVGTFGKLDRNAVASSLEGIFLLSLVMLSLRRRAWVVWLIASGVIAYALLLTASRGAWIGLGFAIFLWGYLRGYRQFQSLYGRVILLIVLIGVMILMFGNTSLSNIAFLTSDSGRSDLFNNVKYLWGDTWLTGIGLGQPFTMVYSTFVLLIYVPFLRYAHNIFFQIGLGQGLLGLTSFIALLVGLYLDVKANRSKVAVDQRPIFDAIWLGLTATLLHGMVDSTQFIEFLSLPPLFILMGLTARFCPYRTTFKVQRRYLYRIGAGLAVALLLVGLISWKSLMADFYVNKAALTLIDASLAPNLTEMDQTKLRDQASSNLQRALAYRPEHSGAQRWLGLIDYWQEDFEAAIPYFTAAITTETDNFTLWKGLGYAYLWSGDEEMASFYLKHVPEAHSELASYAQWWRGRGYPDRSEHAIMVQRILAE